LASIGVEENWKEKRKKKGRKLDGKLIISHTQMFPQGFGGKSQGIQHLDSPLPQIVNHSFQFISLTVLGNNLSPSHLLTMAFIPSLMPAPSCFSTL